MNSTTNTITQHYAYNIPSTGNFRLQIVDKNSIAVDDSSWIRLTPKVIDFILKNWDKFTESPEYGFIQKLEKIKEQINEV